ncbi:hypothetical protein DFR24_0505 [Panacagrimonas perspica]|uniref:Uncharacterized protein n=1 Tax=Panacagrimonas perspica TaxID=381431 RepID=A0A4S3K1C1_9GAMM|nr:hypothetical protein [Panacagrimonas perspica]TDU31146.1 hypothetical protein DFR24_0505 [Panacagrimonas perspica]THD01723.1 hypothetical protein B1810_17040 [Panacagrimonas perspica]
MNKPPESQLRNKDRPAPKDRRLPVDPDRAPDEGPDEAVEGRDRLSENEGRRMDPGISDSSHS